MEGRYEVAIIGTGPAGLEAALTLKNRNKNFVLIGSRNLSNKVEKAHAIQNYLGLPNVSGKDMMKAFQDHIDSMGIEITEERVSTVYAMGDYFALQAGEGMIEAEAVILATGVVAGKTLPGEDALLGRGVSYCATCDAALYRGKNVIVIGYSAKEEEEAEFLSGMAAHVSYIPMYNEPAELPEKVSIVREKPVEIKAEGGVKKVVTDLGEYEADGIFVLRDAISPGQLVPGLETDGSHVTVDRKMCASLPGCFAAGDIVGTPYQYIKAAGEGNIAAISAAAYVDALHRKK